VCWTSRGNGRKRPPCGSSSRRRGTGPGFTDERIELYRTQAEPEGQPEPGMEVVLMALDEALDAVVEGRLRDAKTALGILLAASRGEGSSAL
jgi:hypothetical protein